MILKPLSKRLPFLVLFSFILLFAVISLSGFQSGEKTEDSDVTYTNPRKETDYLYYMDYTDYTAYMYPENASPVFTGCCSSIRNGNFYGRNLDLSYCEIPEFVIHMEHSENHFESIAVCANPLITPYIDEMTEEDFLTLPNIANDGINENGVLINENVVLTGGVDDRTGTSPGKEKILAPYVCRYVLDHAESAEHAVSLLENLDIIGGFEDYGLHWMIADPKDTYIVEIINNKVVAKKNEFFYMTNFYLNYGPVEESQFAAGKEFRDLPTLNSGAIGVERWCEIRDHYKETASVSGMMDLLQKVRATAPYSLQGDDRYYTEFTNSELTIDHSKEEYDLEYDLQCELYQNRDRSNPQGDWSTWHSSVYDIEDKALYISVQEDYEKEFIYTLSDK